MSARTLLVLSPNDLSSLYTQPEWAAAFAYDLPTDRLGSAARKLQAIFATTGATFIAQARLRDELAARIQKRLKIRKHHEYEELFDLYYGKLRPDELRLHRTIRAYTESILHDYNKRALGLLMRNSRLGGSPDVVRRAETASHPLMRGRE